MHPWAHRETRAAFQWGHTQSSLVTGIIKSWERTTYQLRCSAWSGGIRRCLQYAKIPADSFMARIKVPGPPALMGPERNLAGMTKGPWTQRYIPQAQLSWIWFHQGALWSNMVSLVGKSPRNKAHRTALSNDLIKERLLLPFLVLLKYF